MAKRAYKIKIINKEDIVNLPTKQKIVWDIVNDLSVRNNIKMPEV
jgi:hypothetical protein